MSYLLFIATEHLSQGPEHETSKTVIRAVDLDKRYIFSGSWPDYFAKCLQTFAGLRQIYLTIVNRDTNCDMLTYFK